MRNIWAPREDYGKAPKKLKIFAKILIHGLEALHGIKCLSVLIREPVIIRLLAASSGRIDS